MHKWFTFLLIALPIISQAQKKFTHEDSLRGSVTPERLWWNLLHYDLSVSIYPDGRCIEGSNTITYVPLMENKRMQIDLQAPLEITRVVQHEKNLNWTKIGAHYFIELQDPQVIGKTDSIHIYYGGKPHQAKRAPWDGGFTWSKDSNGKEFIATSCQGIGASIWWPCKDHMYDEPDNGMIIRADVPKDLIAVANGKLIAEKELPKKRKQFVWKVVNPINNYGVNINVGDYVNFGETYNGEKGSLEMSYWVLRENLEKAKIHFKQAPMMMKAFEYWFGPYPFYEDSYKLVEVPYLGMEHQSSVTYGNKYKQGYMGMDLSFSGWGLKFDYLIIHESGHEWFANNITYKDIADMWIHESFTTYSECLFVEYYYGTEAGAEYVIGSRRNIENKAQIIGEYDVNHEGDGDMYTKGANIIHTLRQFARDDEHWRSILRGLNSDFYHQTVTTQQIEHYLSKELMVMAPFFDQYLREANIPTLELVRKNGRMSYRWKDCINAFTMPVRIFINSEEHWFTPTIQANEFPVADDAVVEVDKNFYIKTELTNPEE